MAQKLAKFEKNHLEISRVKISKMEGKIKIPASTRFLYYQSLLIKQKNHVYLAIFTKNKGNLILDP